MKRGMTPLIAVIILLLITIVSGGLFYVYIKNTEEKFIQGTQEAMESQEKRLYGRISIISVWNESTKICMLIRNTSDREVTFTAQELSKFAYLINNVPYDVDSGTLRNLPQGSTITICICNNPSCGSRYFEYRGGKITISVVTTTDYKVTTTYDFQEVQ